MKFSKKQKRGSEAADILLDPVRCAEILLRSFLWGKQKEILLSLNTHPRTAVKACHASGKTFVAAVAVLWWLITHPKGIVLTTAPTWLQVERVLWGEIHAAVNRAGYEFPRPSATKLDLAPDRFAIGLSTDRGVNFQGFHSDNILVTVDEAPGVLPEIYEAIAGISAGGNVRILALGNPVIASGPFYEAFTDNRESWNLITIGAFDTPNLAGLTLESLLQLPDHELDLNSHPHLTTRRWVKERYNEWGPGHPLWESRVLGNFPTQSEDALFSLTCLEQAKLRAEGDGDLYAGIDVAGPGEDETVLCVRRGPKIVLLRTWANRDPRGDVVAALLPYKGSLKAVNIDSAGIGYYMAQHLKDHKFPVKEINVGERAKNSEKFFNRKAEVYWCFRMRLEAGDVACLVDERAIAQLVGTRYSHNSRGQVVIESKEDARKRGVKSPDRGESVILAFVEDQELILGLIEYLKETETAQRSAAPKPQDPVQSYTATQICPKCSSEDLQHSQLSWRCNRCLASGFEKPECPKCHRVGVKIPGSGFACNHCGNQWGARGVVSPFRRGGL